MDGLDLEIKRVRSLHAIACGLTRLNWLAAATRFEIAMRRHHWALKAGFNPDQPRDEIGQWTDANGNVVQSRRVRRTGDNAPSMDGGNSDGRSSGEPGLVQVAADNQRQNKTVRDIAVQLRLTQDQAQQLHREISGQGLGYHEILQIAKDMFQK